MPKLKQPTTIRDLVQRTLDAKELSPYDLAKMPGVKMTASSIYYWLRGERDIGVSKAERIMQALGLTVTGALKR